MLFFFPGLLQWTSLHFPFMSLVNLYIFFSFLLIYGGLRIGVLGLGSWIGFFVYGFSIDGVWGLWCGTFKVFLALGLFITQKMKPEKNNALLSLICKHNNKLNCHGSWKIPSAIWPTRQLFRSYSLLYCGWITSLQNHRYFSYLCRFIAQNKYMTVLDCAMSQGLNNTGIQQIFKSCERYVSTSKSKLW